MPSRYIGPVIRGLKKTVSDFNSVPFTVNDKLSPEFKKNLQRLYLNLGKLLAYYDALPKEEKRSERYTDCRRYDNT